MTYRSCGTDVSRCFVLKGVWAGNIGVEGAVGAVPLILWSRAQGYNPHVLI